MTEPFTPTTGVPAAPEPEGSDSGAGSTAPAGERTDMRAVLEEQGVPDCPECGSTEEPRADGFCPDCGQRRPVARDHLEFRLGSCVGLTDRGLRRRRNEDAVALGRIPTPGGELLVGVVCDGVASARRGDEASLAAAQAAVEAVLARVQRDGSGTLDGLGATAASAAAEAAAELGRAGNGADPPACTYVGAVVREGSAVVSWVGDSRIYWLAPDGTSQLLSTDDSWAEEIAAAGLMPREQAHNDRRAHVLTRWMGFDSPPGPARARRFRPAGPGLLLLCSDGLWNHIPSADALAGRLTGGDALDEARALVGAALDEGGFDNATVALLPVIPSGGEGEWEPEPSERTGPIAVPGLEEGRDDHPEHDAYDTYDASEDDPEDPAR